MNTTHTTTNSVNAPTVKPAKSVATPAKGDPKRGLKKAEVIALLKGFKFPSEPFTVRQVYTEIGARHWLIRSFIKKNAQIVGDAPKTAGVNGKPRGKIAKLYQLPADRLNY